MTATAAASRIPRCANQSLRCRSLTSSSKLFQPASASAIKANLPSSSSSVNASTTSDIPIEAQYPPTHSRIGVVPPPIQGPKLTGWKRSLLLKGANLIGYHPAKQAAVRSTNAYYNVTSEQSERDARFWFEGQSDSIYS